MEEKIDIKLKTNEICTKLFQNDINSALLLFESIIELLPFNLKNIDTLTALISSLSNYEFIYEQFIDLSKVKRINIIKFNLEQAYFDRLLLDNNFARVEVLLNHMLTYYADLNDTFVHNLVVPLSYRISDIKTIQKVINGIDDKISKERFKLIEILGFFVTAIAFIFSFIQITNNAKNINDAKYLLILFSIVLFSFLLVLVVIFSDWKNERLKTIISLCLILSLIGFFYSFIF